MSILFEIRKRSLRNMLNKIGPNSKTLGVDCRREIIPFLYLAIQNSELLCKLKFELYESGMAHLPRRHRT